MTGQTFSKGDRVKVTALRGDPLATVTEEETDGLRGKPWWHVTFDRPSPYLDTCYYAHELERVEDDEEVAA